MRKDEVIYKERRNRIKRPKSVLLVCTILFSLPIFYILFVFLTYSLYWKDLYHLLSIFNLIEFLFILTPFVLSIGLYNIQKWAWWALLIYAVTLGLYNGFTWFLNQEITHVISFIQTIIGFSFLIFFLKKDISSPYMKLYPRGWRGEKRTPIQIPIKIDGELTETKDLSPNGIYIATNNLKANLNEEVVVVFQRFPDLQFHAGVVREDKHGTGLAFRNLKSEERKILKSLAHEMNG